MTGRSKCHTVDVYLFPEPALLTLGAVIDPLIIANQIAGRDLYKVRLISENGAPVTAASGIVLSSTQAVSPDGPAPDLMLVYSGVEIDPKVSKKSALGMLRADLARPGTQVDVEIFGARRPAVVQEDQPLWDPKNERLRA